LMARWRWPGAPWCCLRAGAACALALLARWRWVRWGGGGHGVMLLARWRWGRSGAAGDVVLGRVQHDADGAGTGPVDVFTLEEIPSGVPREQVLVQRGRWPGLGDPTTLALQARWRCWCAGAAAGALVLGALWRCCCQARWCCWRGWRCRGHDAVAAVPPWARCASRASTRTRTAVGTALSPCCRTYAA
jgi:hypothetical protein